MAYATRLALTKSVQRTYTRVKAFGKAIQEKGTRASSDLQPSRASQLPSACACTAGRWRANVPLHKEAVVETLDKWKGPAHFNATLVDAFVKQALATPLQ